MIIIKKIYRDKKSIKIHNKDGEIFEFDKIIFAVHADQVLDLLEKPSKEEMDIFSKFKYTIERKQYERLFSNTRI